MVNIYHETVQSGQEEGARIRCQPLHTIHTLLEHLSTPPGRFLSFEDVMGPLLYSSYFVSLSGFFSLRSIYFLVDFYNELFNCSHFQLQKKRKKYQLNPHLQMRFQMRTQFLSPQLHSGADDTCKNMAILQTGFKDSILPITFSCLTPLG